MVLPGIGSDKVSLLHSMHREVEKREGKNHRGDADGTKE